MLLFEIESFLINSETENLSFGSFIVYVRCSNDVDTACSSETKIRQADGLPSFFTPWSTNLLVSVGQITRQRINYFYVN